jgi:phage gp36-like protein
MMAYSTITDIYKVISTYDLARVTGDAAGSSVDTERVNYAIYTADSFIDSYLAKVYDLPLTFEHQLLKALSVNLALVLLYEYYMSDSALPDTIKSRKRFVIQNITKLQEGETKLINERRIPTKSKIMLNYERNAITKEELNDYGD